MNIDKQKTYPKRLLNKGSGFLSGYSHTLNPYTGCAFACSYCYVRQMPVQLFRNQDWGEWVDVKQNAGQLLEKELKSAKKKGSVTIFMSSSTDPYQPIEYKERVTRQLLEAMVHEQPDFLFVQTRSSLVTRDIDLFQQLKDKVRISITIETDSDEIRKAFSPSAPPIAGRLKALATLRQAGIPTQAAIAPLLPSSPAFAELLHTYVDRVCVDDFFMGDGSGGKRTERLNIERIFKELNLEKWYEKDAYQKLISRLYTYFEPEQIRVSKDGFLP
ncbi:DNA repair photolyase [Alkalihalobacillus xiaoxiensis]|uniref:DNA repair photolyase n=1 Tax=Shouchella xiaoxiensis TaxID=766895 RepID=A0ABS2SVU4_9BACI|nr:radical SAM protein [Shouchella xiaoxiensis]MBM7839659.1 DNA repair photolyase [Shouchella xiaoxiensis]